MFTYNKLVVTFGLLFIATVFAQSQVIDSYGIKAGVVLATTSRYSYGGDFDEGNFRTGLAIGGFVRLFDMKLFHLSSEFYYIQKGYSYHALFPGDPSFLMEERNVVVSRDYFSIPILANLHLGSEEHSPFILAGPRFDILVYSDNDRNVNFFDIGYSAGLGFTIAIAGNRTLSFEGRISPSLMNVHNRSFIERNKSYEILTGITL